MSRSVLDTVVSTDLCVGCGICAAVCPTGNLRMSWSGDGTRIPIDTGRCGGNCSLCWQVCPFGDGAALTDDLARSFFATGKNTTQVHDVLGYYIRAYLGHVQAGEYRQAGSSGGMARWFLSRLLDRGDADNVLCVFPKKDPACLFTYRQILTSAEVRGASKSAYYPVEVSEVLGNVAQCDARVAVTALPCVARGLRLASLRLPVLRERIVSVVGLVCGGMRSRLLVEKLARAAGFSSSDILRIVFRNKSSTRPTDQYHVSIEEEGGTKEILWPFHRTWAAGEFKLRPCLYCDDVFAELADVSFMDAWLPQHLADSAGTSIAVVRSQLAYDIVEEGMASGDLAAASIPAATAAESQRGLIVDKRGTSRSRLWIAAKHSWSVPQTRASARRPSLIERFGIEARESVRRTSFCAMRKQQKPGEAGLRVYERSMRRPLLRLRMANKLFALLQRVRRLARL